MLDALFLFYSYSLHLTKYFRKKPRIETHVAQLMKNFSYLWNSNFHYLFKAARTCVP